MKTKEAKDILLHKDEILEEIREKLAALYKEMLRMENSDELLAATALPAAKAAGEATGSAGPKDNLDVLLRYYRRRKEYGEEIRRQMWRLSEKEERVLRLWNCFLILPRPYYGILNELYVKKELYAVVEASSGYCHSVFEKKRKEGMGLLVELFGSPYSSLELIERIPAGPVAEKHKHGKKEKDGQLELPLDEL